MPSPFPGIDPYLGQVGIWPSLHGQLINNAFEALQPVLLPRYIAVTGVRVYIEPAKQERTPDVYVVAPRVPEPQPRAGVAVAERVAVVSLPEPEWVASDPGIEVREPYIEIRDLAGNEVITVIEILSPTNKAPGPGRDAYRAKQGEVLLSTANLVEIDLLRAGWPTVAAPPDAVREGEYLVCTRRLQRPGGFEVVRFGVRDPLPAVAVPLRPGEPDVLLDLAGVFARCYDTGAYAYRVDYTRPPDPPLPPEEAAWAQALLSER